MRNGMSTQRRAAARRIDALELVARTSGSSIRVHPSTLAPLLSVGLAVRSEDGSARLTLRGRAEVVNGRRRGLR